MVDDEVRAMVELEIVISRLVSDQQRADIQFGRLLEIFWATWPTEQAHTN